MGLTGLSSVPGKLSYQLLVTSRDCCENRKSGSMSEWKAFVWRLPRLYPFLWQSFLHPALPSLLPVNGFGGTCRARVTRHIFSLARPHLPAWEQKSVQVGTVLSEVLAPGFRRSFLSPEISLLRLLVAKNTVYVSWLSLHPLFPGLLFSLSSFILWVEGN